jgi:hypothetical protein
MRQKIGELKHKRCEEIAGIKFSGCYARGGTPYWALCQTLEGNDLYRVNYKTGEFYLSGKDGQYVTNEPHHQGPVRQ